MLHLSKVLATFIISVILQNVLTSPSVRINGTQIVGQRINVILNGTDVNQYLGIPYAEPPVGPLRFQKPQLIQSYPPKFEAFTNPPDCPQYSTQPYPWYSNSSNKSEDCLYLNIWTPADASPTNKKAVLYWIHGGGFKLGSIGDILYSGVPMASLGDIIVVTVNYRLGVFGFFTSGTEDVPDNVGLWDILEGLKWVNRNIKAFGGDVHRITLAGESAGATSSGLLTTSPLATGLYTRLILQSGSPLNPAFGEKNSVLAQRLAKEVGCANDSYTIAMHPEDIVQCLREVDAATLSEADSPLDTVSFEPQFTGDALFPEKPRDAVRNGKYTCKDLLIGNNRDEGSLFVTFKFPEIYGPHGEKDPHIDHSMALHMIDTLFGSFPDIQSITQYYLPSGNSTTEDLSRKIRHQTYTELGDLAVACSDVFFAEKCAEQEQKVYFYLFNHRPSTTPFAEWMGVAHFEEVQFVFGQPVLNPEKYHSSEVALSRQMIDIWTGFVKHGKPSIRWPLYSRAHPLFKFLGPETVSGKNGHGPHLRNCNFLRKFL